MENILLIALNVGKELRGEKMSKENKLLIRFTRFMLEHGIECEEDIYQNDDIDRDSFELIEDLFNIVKSNNSRKDDKQTNADRIREMSDEELAEFLNGVEEYGISSHYIDVPCDCCCEKTACDECWKEWLKLEAE